MKPSTNTGTAESAAVPTVVSLSASEYRRTAESTPTEMPTTISMRMAQNASRRLLTAFSPRISLTLWRSEKDSPRSHWTVRTQ